MADMEAMAKLRGSMDDSFHLPDFPHMAWVNLSALPAIAIMPAGLSLEIPTPRSIQYPRKLGHY